MLSTWFLDNVTGQYLHTKSPNGEFDCWSKFWMNEKKKKLQIKSKQQKSSKWKQNIHFHFIFIDNFFFWFCFYVIFLECFVSFRFFLKLFHNSFSFPPVYKYLHTILLPGTRIRWRQKALFDGANEKASSLVLGFLEFFFIMCTMYILTLWHCALTISSYSNT